MDPKDAHARIIPTCTCSLHRTTGTVTTEHYSNTYPTARGHITFNPMEEFKGMLDLTLESKKLLFVDITC